MHVRARLVVEDGIAGQIIAMLGMIESEAIVLGEWQGAGSLDAATDQ
jgi:hypothetical protein